MGRGAYFEGGVFSVKSLVVEVAVKIFACYYWFVAFFCLFVGEL